MASSADPLSNESLYDLLYACQRGQRVAIVGSHTDENPLRKRLYVEQEEDEIVDGFFSSNYSKDGRLLILTGSAGDGKSALIARGYDSANEAFPEDRVNMDATEARTRDGDYADRLTDFLDRVIDDVESRSGHRSAIAINYGLAVDYFERRGAPTEFDVIWDAMQMSQRIPIYTPQNVNISVINLSHRRTYDTHPDRLGEGLVRQLLDRFDPTTGDSPFAAAYERENENCPAGDECVLRYNIRQLTQTIVKDELARLFAGWSVATGSYLNPRTIIDGISTLVLPTVHRELPEHNVCPVGAAIEQGDYKPTEKDLLWNGVFDTLGTSKDSTSSMVDPASRTSFELDLMALQWAMVDAIIDDKMPAIPEVAFSSTAGRVRTVLRKQYLKNEAGETVVDRKTFKDFLSALTFFCQDDSSEELVTRAQEVLKTTRTALSSWTGREREDGLVEFVDGLRSTEYRYLSKWNDPDFDHEGSKTETQSLAVPGRIKLMAEAPENRGGKHVPIPLAFETYRLMTQISQGYTPNATDLDQSHAIKMLHSRLEDFTDKRERVIIEDRSESRRITISDEDLQIVVSSEGLK